MRHPLPCNLAVAAFVFAAAPISHANSLSNAFTPSLGYTGEAAAIIDGGKDNGSAYAGQLKFGGNLDLDTAFGWQGATLKAFGVYRHGTNLSRSSLGNSTSVQEIYGGQGTRLAMLTLQQKLFNDHLVIEAGRSSAGNNYLTTETCQYLQNNAACGNPTYVFRSSNFTWWPVSSWMANATINFDAQRYFQIGGFQVDHSQAEDGEHGLRWNTHGASGWIVPYALGWRSDAQAQHKALYEIGGWQDNSRYSDPLVDANGIPALLSGLDYRNRHGRSGAYARVEQQLTGSDQRHGLTVFGSVMKGTSGQLIEDWYVQAGLMQKGICANRPDDVLAFVASRQQYSDIALQNLRLTRAAAGGSGTPQSSQTMLELSYAIQVTPQLRIAPNLHYIIHPDQFNEPSRLHDLPNTWVAGLRLDWNL
jgi:porin